MAKIPLTNHYFVLLPTAKDCTIPFEDPNECQKFVDDYFKVQRVIWSRLESFKTVNLDPIRIDFSYEGCVLSVLLSHSLDDDNLWSILSNFFSTCYVLLHKDDKDQ